MNKPLVTVFICVFNRPDYVEHCIQSIIDQTYINFELIIIDDCSTNKQTLEILNKFENTDTRINIIHNKQNIGLTKSLNIGLKLCNGEYITRQDSDDYSHPTRLEKQVKILNENKNIDFVSTAYYDVNPKDKILASILTKDDSIIEHEILNKNVFNDPVTMYKKKVFDKLGEYDEYFYTCQTYNFNLRALLYFNAIVIREPLYYYRKDKKQSIRYSKFVKEYWKDIDVIQTAIMRANTYPIIKNNVIIETIEYSYIIGSGWFVCDLITNDVEKLTVEHQHKYGGKSCRNSNFSKLWLENILYYCKKLPDKIIIVDSNSPVKLDNFVLLNDLVEIVDLINNPGHSLYCEQKGIVSGWEKSVIMGAMYALMNSVDYYVYIEQDSLVFGYNWLNIIINNMRKNNKQICFHSGNETPHKIQVSLIVVSKDFLPTFITRLIEFNDNFKSDESKLYDRFKDDLIITPFQGGRQRKNLNSMYYSKQHMNQQELDIEIKKHNHLQI
jgi:glycosyltransferase involved in cell wall biosynthesis